MPLIVYRCGGFMFKIVSFFMILLTSKVVLANFLGVATSPESSINLDLSSCKYSEIYSSYFKTYLIFNLVERVSKANWSEILEVKKAFENQTLEVSNKCGAVLEIDLDSVVLEGASKIIFKYGAGEHSLEWVTDEGPKRLVYKKLYGAYANEPLLEILDLEDDRTLTRAVGRFGVEHLDTRYTFFYKGIQKDFVKKIELKASSLSDFKPLKTIYGDAYEAVPAKIKIGVVGTGLDYNHPGVAKRLAFRGGIEENAQQIESVKNDLRQQYFPTVEAYEAKNDLLEDLQVRVGFPRWMDQALGTKRPIDEVIVNEVVATPSIDHETRVTSRIISGDGDIEIYFARRSMGTFDTFNAHEVIGKFVENGVKLVNLSMGGGCGVLPKEDQQWSEVFLKYPNVIFVVSAGNSGLNTADQLFCPVSFSQQFKNVISVTALNGEGLLAHYAGTSVNYGVAIDLAIKADNLPVLYPYRATVNWENNPFGATSLATAEVSRIITEAYLDNLPVDPATVKGKLIESSVYRFELNGLTKYSAEVDEEAFRTLLRAAPGQ